MKKLAALFFSVTVFYSLCVPASMAITLMTEEEALHYVFSDTENIDEIVYQLDGASLAAIRERLGGKWADYEDGNYRVVPPAKVTFYFLKKDGIKTTAAVILEEAGKWGPIQFIVAIDTATLSIKNMAVLRYQETRGRPIARSSFMSQFFGKTASDPFMVRKDIVGISGATYSSKAAAFCAKKALVLYEELALKKQGVQK